MEINRLVRADQVDDGEIIETTEGWKVVQNIEVENGPSSGLSIGLVKLTVEGRVYPFSSNDLINSRGYVGHSEGTPT
jgi:hypothetical protein